MLTPELKNEIDSETKRLLKEFVPHLESEFEKAKDKSNLLLCLTEQHPAPEYFPQEQAVKSHVSELIGVLRANAQIFGMILPYSYENLAIITRDVDREEFAAKLHAARDIVASYSFGRTLQQDFITITFGVSSYPFDANDPHELFKQAGLALQAAKKAGGNTVRCYWN